MDINNIFCTVQLRVEHEAIGWIGAWDQEGSCIHTIPGASPCDLLGGVGPLLSNIQYLYTVFNIMLIHQVIHQNSFRGNARRVKQ